MRATFSAAAVYGAFALFFLASPGMAHTLENSQVRVRFDDRGGMTELVDKRSDATRNLISKPRAGVWKLIFQKGMSLENVINPDGQDTRVEPFGPGLRLLPPSCAFVRRSSILAWRYRSGWTATRFAGARQSTTAVT